MKREGDGRMFRSLECLLNLEKEPVVMSPTVIFRILFYLVGDKLA